MGIYEKHIAVGMEHSKNEELVKFVLKDLKQGLLQPLVDAENGAGKVIYFSNVRERLSPQTVSKIFTQTLTVEDLVICENCERYNKRFGWCERSNAEMLPNDFCSRGRKREE